MNYYNPYLGFTPYTPVATASASKGLLSSLFGGGKLSSFINGTQKTLGIINQAIPIVKQVSPVVKNAKTMFKVMTEFKRVDNPKSNQNDASVSTTKDDVSSITENQTIETKMVSNNNGPTFFL